MGLCISALAQALYHARHRHTLLLETALLERVADGFLALDQSYRFRYINPSATRSLGLSPASGVVGRAIADTVRNVAQSDFFRSITQAVCEQRAIHGEVANPAGVGWLELHAYPSAAGVSVYFSDVTERRLMENLLRDGEARLSGILSSAMDAIVSIDDSQRIVLFNPAAEKLFRYQAQDLIGKPIEQLMPARYRDRHASYVKQFDETGATRRMMGGYGAVIGLRADGEELNLEVSISKVVHTNSKIFTAIIRDITQKMRMEHELRSSQNLLQATLSAMNARIAVLDRHGTIIKVNDAWERFSRESAGDRYGQQGVGQNYLAVCDAVTGKDRDDAAEVATGLRAVIAGERAHFGFEYPCNSTERDAWYLLSANPLFGEIAGAVVAHIDITAQKAVETALAGAVRQLRELAGAVQDAEEGERKRIALELHDELGQDLTALRLELTWLESRIGKVPGEQLSPKIADLKGRLDATMRAVRRIISDLRPSMLDELGLTSALEWLAEDFATRTGVSCHVIVESNDIEVPDRLATAIFRIVQEALTNVWRHAEASHVEIEIESSRDAGMVVTVSDDGIGIVSKSFEKPKSYGIRGMRERAALFGGLVQLQSDPGKGTAVRISFPWPPYREEPR
jgi:PAS domain S-box-containing protein